MTHWTSAARLLARQTLELLPLLPRRPIEFWDRWLGCVENRWQSLQTPPSYLAQPWDMLVEGLNQHLGISLDTFLQEEALTHVEQAINAEMERQHAIRPFPFKHNASFALGHMCYAVCRALQPAAVIETGVAYGVTSSFILQALQVNGNGMLYSIDLPPTFDREDYAAVGALIPDALRANWRLHIGASRRVLPQLLKQVGQVDIFIHDSLHTHRNMLWEFATVQPYLQPKSMVLFDDVHMNGAFEDCVQRAQPQFHAVLDNSPKTGYSGLCCFRQD